MSKTIRTILIISDSPQDRATYRHYLSQEGEEIYEFLEAKLGATGLAACLTHQPDGILLEDRLQDMNALEFLMRLKSSQETAVWPLIILADVADMGAAEQTLQRGAQDYLVKDNISPETLHRALRTAMLRAARQQQLEQQYRDLLTQNQELEAQQAALHHKLAECQRLNEDLSQKEQRLRLAISTAQMGCWEWNPKANEVTWNEQLEKLFGLSPDSFIGTYGAFLDLLHPDDRQRIEQTLPHILAENTKVEAEFRIVRPSDEVRWLNGKGQLFRDAAGQPEYVLGLVSDVSERKRAEEFLARYQLLSDHARDIVLFIHADDGHIVEANQAAVAAYGYDYDTLLTKNISDLRDPTTHSILRQQMQQADVAGILFETRHCRSDGSIFPVEVSSRGADMGEKRLLLSVVRDISGRKQAEEALRHQQERLSVVLQAGRMGWWDRDLRTNETVWSDSLYDLLGQAPGDQPGYDLFLQRVHPEDRQMVQDKVRQAIDKRRRYTAEFRLLHPNGGARWVLEKGQILYDEAGEPQRMVGVSLDITRRKWIEEGLRESEAILRSIYDCAPLLMGLVEIGEDDILHLYDNPATHRFYGLEAAESTTGKWASQLGMPQSTILKWLSHFRASEADSRSVHFEDRPDTPSGPRRLSVTITALGSGYSGRPRFCYVAEDLTERTRVDADGSV